MHAHEIDAVGDVRTQDVGALARIETIVRIRAGLVLRVESRRTYFSDIVMETADARHQRVGAYRRGRGVGEQPDVHGVLECARRIRHQTAEKRMVVIEPLVHRQTSRVPERPFDHRSEDEYRRCANQRAGGRRQRVGDDVSRWGARFQPDAELRERRMQRSTRRRAGRRPDLRTTRRSGPPQNRRPARRRRPPLRRRVSGARPPRRSSPMPPRVHAGPVGRA